MALPTITPARALLYHDRMTTRYCATIDSPAGPLHLAVDQDGRLSSVWFGVTTSVDQVGADLRRMGHDFVWDAGPAAQVIAQISEYSTGGRTSFDLDLDMQGTDWERSVWRALLEIPFGETRSYGQIATRLGDPTKARAVGWANAANPIPVIVPCHRVIGADRTMTGFGGGIETKIKLLIHEGAMLL